MSNFTLCQEKLSTVNSPVLPLESQQVADISSSKVQGIFLFAPFLKGAVLEKYC